MDDAKSARRARRRGRKALRARAIQEVSGAGLSTLSSLLDATKRSNPGITAGGHSISYLVSKTLDLALDFPGRRQDSSPSSPLAPMATIGNMSGKPKAAMDHPSLAPMATVGNLPEKPQAAMDYPSSSLVDRPHHIRVIRLQPSSDNDRPSRLRCTMEIISLDADPQPEYEALSYTWGDRSRDETVVLNGKHSQITGNLASALQGLRRTAEERTLWVDALCINQADKEERNQQVAKMGAIYRQATRVLVWLGTLDESKLTGALTMNDVWPAEFRAAATQTISLDRIASRTGKQDRPYAAMLRMIQFTAPRHWDRAWVVQETVVNCTAPAYCLGNLELAESDLIAISLHAATQHETDEVMAAAELNEDIQALAKFIAAMRALRKEASSRWMMRVMADTGSKVAMDLRDLVYSVLNLVDPGETHAIRVDYNQSWTEVYARATWAALNANIAPGSWHALCFVQRQARSSRITTNKEAKRLGHRHSLGTPQLPTWAVDFNSDSRHMARWQNILEQIPLPLAIEHSVTISRDAKLLSYRGIEMTRIFVTAAVHTPAGTSTSRFRETTMGSIAASALSPLEKMVREALRARSVQFDVSETLNKTEAEVLFPRALHRTRGKAPASLIEIYDNFATYAQWDFATFFTESGELGLCLGPVEAGDFVVLLPEAPAPVVLRQDGEHFTFQGLVQLRGFAQLFDGRHCSLRERPLHLERYRRFPPSRDKERTESPAAPEWRDFVLC